jgi:50S ribosomal protein L16 3-hydroxylase
MLYTALWRMILEQFPSIDEFYQIYWNKRPFVVRGGVDVDVFQDLIDGDSLAALSLEEEVKSRIVVTAPEGNKWACDHGPFDENYFSTLKETHWSLLVQNVEQYHPNTAKLLHDFHFAPRWLMDDIMVSYSAPGGSVGPHTDSYHVFLVQGQGRRQWTIGRDPIKNGDCIEGLDLKVLKNGVEGETVEVTMGDVIYLPPHFAHEGTTIEEAMTFSIGFLGPQLSEMMIEYGHYLEEQEKLNTRYSGENLNAQSSGFMISSDEQGVMRGDLIDAIKADDFTAWLATYFSTPTYDDVENIDPRVKALSFDEIFKQLKEGEHLYCPNHVKLSITNKSDETFNLSVYGALFQLSKAHEDFILWLSEGKIIELEDIKTLGGADLLCEIITILYNKNVLFFENEDLIAS